MPVRSASTLRPRALVAAVLLLGGCRTWHAERVPVAGDTARAIGRHARATWADGRRVELANARVERDTLRAEEYLIVRGRGRVPVAVPLDSVRALEVRRVSWRRVVAVTAAIYLAIAIPGMALSGGFGS